MIYALAYQSRLAAGVSQSALEAIVMKARAYNGKHAITGSLYYNDQDLLQFLEGDRKDLSRLFHRIKADQSHNSIRLIGLFQLERRNFKDRHLDMRSVNATHMQTIINTLYGLKHLPGKHLIATAAAQWSINLHLIVAFRGMQIRKRSSKTIVTHRPREALVD